MTTRVWAILAAGAALLGLALSGCTSTRLMSQHPLLNPTDNNVAQVYFLRPYTERAMGFPDNPVTVELEDATLLTLGKGEYTLLRLKPRASTPLTLKNQSAVGPFWNTREMHRSRNVELLAGHTYYWVIKPVDGEFRGIYFIAEDADAAAAGDIAQRLHPVGLAAAQPLLAHQE